MGKLDNLQQNLSAVIKSIDRLDNHKSFLKGEIDRYEAMKLDLDHKLELENLDGVELMRLVSLRKKILLGRRQIKDELELVNAILEATSQTQTAYEILRKVKKAAEDTSKRQQNRTYTPRILYDEFSMTEEQKQAAEDRKRDRQLYRKRSGHIDAQSMSLAQKFREIESKQSQ